MNEQNTRYEEITEELEDGKSERFKLLTQKIMEEENEWYKVFDK
jgi:hypothetical protein